MPDNDAESLDFFWQTPAPAPAPVPEMGVIATNAPAIAAPPPAPAAAPVMAPPPPAPAPSPDGFTRENWVNPLAGRTLMESADLSDMWKGVGASDNASGGAATINPAANTGGGFSAEEIANLYRNGMSRDPDAVGAKFWQDFSAKNGKEATLAAFNAAMNAQGVKGTTTMAHATTAYGGFKSANGNSIVDEWARNVYNRAATPEEIARFGNFTSADQAAKAYQDFLMANRGVQGKQLSFMEASRLNAPDATKPNPSGLTLPTAVTIDPTLRTVDPTTETMQGQLDGILAKNSILMQRAAAQAREQAQRRGLMNSTMAEEAAQGAIMDKALPIAQNDAGVYDKNAATNQQVSNSVNATNAEAQNKFALTGYTTEAEMLKQQRDIDANMQLQNIKNDASKELAEIEAKYKTEMQASEGAKTLYTNISKNITDIMSNPNIPAAEKGKLVTQQSELLRSGLAIVSAGTSLDFQRLLDFSGGAGSTGTDGKVKPGTLPDAPQSTNTNGTQGIAVGENAGQDAQGSVTGGSTDGVGNNANGDAAGVGAGPR